MKIFSIVTRYQFIVLFFFIIAPSFAFAEFFNISQEIDFQGRSQVDVDLVKQGLHGMLYLEKGISIPDALLENLIKEFDERIYPNLVDLFGQPWTPGIDNDSRITVLLTKMISGVGGYFNGEDESSKSVHTTSNEREILYLNSDFISSKKITSFLAHEFQHLVSFNQKTRRLGKEEEVWVNEVRSEYAPTYVKYDDDFPGSNLEERIRRFIEKPHDHLITWNNTAHDYASVNMFSQYLGARFGEKFYREEIKTDTVGLASMEQALKRMNPDLTFSKFFSEWRLTNYLNNPDILNGKYSYKNKNISFKFAPEVSTSLSPSEGSVKTVIASVPTFSAKATSFLLGNKRSSIEFSVPQASPDLVVTYIKELKDGEISEGQFTLDSRVKDVYFGKDVHSVTTLLSNASKSIINTEFTLKATTQVISKPFIKAIESALLTPTLEHNVFLIKGGDFDQGLILQFNTTPKQFTYQNDTTLLMRVAPEDGGTIQISLTNPDGGNTIFLWQNPFSSSQTIQTTQTTQTLPDGSLIRANNDFKVYLIKNGFKRHIIDAKIFPFYEHLKNGKIEIVQPEKNILYASSNLIRASGSEKVYEILSDGKKRWIKSAQEFIARGFDWNAVFEVNEQELNFYPTAS